MSIVRNGALILSAGLLFASSAVQAQPAAGEIGRVIRLKILPGHAGQFEEAYKKHLAWHKEKNDSWNWDAWEYLTGPYTGQLVVVTGGHNWSDFERGEMGREDVRLARETLNPHIESAASLLSRFRTDLSTIRPGPPAPLVEVVTYTLKPGKENDFQLALSKLHKGVSTKAPENRYAWVQVVSGAEKNSQYYVVLARNDWAGFAPPERTIAQLMREMYGEQEADSVRDLFFSCVESYERAALAYRADLSYRPGQ